MSRRSPGAPPIGWRRGEDPNVQALSEYCHRKARAMFYRLVHLPSASPIEVHSRPRWRPTVARALPLAHLRLNDQQAAQTRGAVIPANDHSRQPRRASCRSSISKSPSPTGPARSSWTSEGPLQLQSDRHPRPEARRRSDSRPAHYTLSQPTSHINTESRRRAWHGRRPTFRMATRHRYTFSRERVPPERPTRCVSPKRRAPMSTALYLKHEDCPI